MENMFDKMNKIIKSRNDQKGDELKKKFDERKKKEDDLYEWMEKLHIQKYKSRPQENVYHKSCT